MSPTRPRRWAVLALATSLVLVLATGVATAVHRFSDVPDDHAHADGIAWLVGAGVTAGCEGGAQYCPNEDVTRAQMATFLRRLAGQAPGVPPSVNAARLQGKSAAQLTVEVACPSGMFLRGYEDGTATCASDTDAQVDCPSGSYVRAIAADGTATCATDADPVADCAAGAFVSEIGADRSTVCTPQTTYDGTDFVTSAQSCPAGETVMGFDGAGAVICAPDDDSLGAYALVTSSGDAVDGAHTSGVTSLEVASRQDGGGADLPGQVCFHDLDFVPESAVVTVNAAGTAGNTAAADSIATVVVSAAGANIPTGCPANTDVFVQIYDVSSDAFVDRGFHIWFAGAP